MEKWGLAGIRMPALASKPAIAIGQLLAAVPALLRRPMPNVSYGPAFFDPCGMKPAVSTAFSQYSSPIDREYIDTVVFQQARAACAALGRKGQRQKSTRIRTMSSARKRRNF